MFSIKNLDENAECEGLLKERYITIAAATRATGYNGQYLRRLLRAERLTGVRVGQVWLIHLDTLISYIESIQNSGDRRFGAKRIDQS